MQGSTTRLIVSSLQFAGADRAVVDACRQQVREWLEPLAAAEGQE
jgi:hypothetical protein